MKKFISIFSFLPFINRALNRKYYASGIGVYVVNSFYKRILRANAGGDFLVHFTSQVNQGKNIIIERGKGSETVYRSLASSGSCYYQAINKIYIGTGTMWAPGCQFISANHNFKDLSKSLTAKPVVIGNNVWIGGNVSILPGVNVGNYCIVGAGSVVTKSFESYLIVAGAPAKEIAKRCKICFDKILLTEEICNNCKANTSL